MTNFCQTVFTMLQHVEPTIVLEQLGSATFEIALMMFVKDRCANSTARGVSPDDSQQKAMTDFYMTYNLIIQLTPILPALLLARLSDRGWRKAPIVVSLSGYLLSRITLLLVLIFGLPLKVMFGAAFLFGLFGGFSAYWPGVMTLVSLGSTSTDRSKVIMRLELLYGTAGLVGSLVSGHLFLLQSSYLGHGTILLIVSTMLHLLSLIHSVILLQVQVHHQDTSASCHLLSDTSDNEPVAHVPIKINWVNVVLLYAAAVLYDAAVGGAIEILGTFVLKEPLNWSATQVGYGNAAGFMIFFTSFLGVIVFCRCVSDTSLVLIGMLSFASGIYLMSFVRETSMYYLARALNLFALIPMPMIRSLLSQQVPPSAYGTTLTSLQLALKFASLAYIPAFTRIYQRTLGWFPGFVFLLASIFTVMGMIPISIVGCRLPQRRKIQEN